MNCSNADIGRKVVDINETEKTFVDIQSTVGLHAGRGFVLKSSIPLLIHHSYLSLLRLALRFYHIPSNECMKHAAKVMTVG